MFQYNGKDAHLWLKALERVINADSKEDKHPIAVVNIGDSQDSVTRGTLGKLKHCVKDYAYVVDLERNIARIAEGWKDFKLDFEKYDFKRGVKALWKVFKDSDLAKLEPEVLEYLRVVGFGCTVEGVTTELWTQGKAVKFAETRDALIHLDKLGLVDYENGEYSVRESLL